jgi:hypothetical protein
MLRGQVPQDRNPQEIIFDRTKDVDDMWTQLFFAMLTKNDYGELWYWGGNREKKFAPNFVERWVSSFETYRTEFIPDVIFCRGGFPEYDYVLQRFPKSFKIYYGAGRRFLPITNFQDYNMILVDSPTQQKIAQEKFPNMKSILFFKPAPDRLFYPIEKIKKEYDICYPADGRPPRKGHDFVYTTLPKYFKMLNLGFPTRRFKKPDNVTSYRVLKSVMSEHIQKCKIGIIVSTGGTGLFGLSYDSCPRIIPELLACGLPIVVLDELEFWAEKYITPLTGKLANRGNYWETVKFVLDNLDSYNPRKYYEDNLSLAIAAKFLRRKIDETRF